MLRIALSAALSAGALFASGAAAQSALPSAAEAVRLVREHRTNGYVTVAQTLAYAARARSESFRLADIRAERRPGEDFARVRICYWLRPPGTQALPSCGIGFVVTTNPAHVEPERRFAGLGRDLQDGREAFLRGLDRELAQIADPQTRALRGLLDPYDLYDDR
ncbi:hypothetical protein [Methylobacterium gregans]|uniref:Uncharacterized protein n=1 Tax=Methylobacterium gregans TaxID=374424 RepID=A0AA37HVV0_9HYPH|nr:hypothetical protein [Methylobacterium gregans]MDQ0522914.1 hypothetical protein [Methylobacterium gregans]GJD81523.1 hypothetical protein NBEOAGPD_4774 [Methylobacterium gregans]GLS55809.1 hypothetical protein GCM10007886_39940 [Methylobacterium gregans]